MPFNILLKGFLFVLGVLVLDKRIAVAGIIIEDTEAVEQVNGVLHKYGSIIIGRLGLPYRERGVSVISVIIDADPDEISALTGAIGKIPGVSVRSAISKK